MSQSIRAIYENGWLRLLEPVNLSDGQEIQVTILSERERVQVALGELLAQPTELPEEAIDEAALAGEIEAGFRGQAPLSETIIEERREGP